jgi:DNA-binding GntR family transcriptional regulator
MTTVCTPATPASPWRYDVCETSPVEPAQNPEAGFETTPSAPNDEAAAGSSLASIGTHVSLGLSAAVVGAKAGAMACAWAPPSVPACVVLGAAVGGTGGEALAQLAADGRLHANALMVNFGSNLAGGWWGRGVWAGAALLSEAGPSLRAAAATLAKNGMLEGAIGNAANAVLTGLDTGDANATLRALGDLKTASASALLGVGASVIPDLALHALFSAKPHGVMPHPVVSAPVAAPPASVPAIALHADALWLARAPGLPEGPAPRFDWALFDAPTGNATPCFVRDRGAGGPLPRGGEPVPADAVSRLAQAGVEAGHFTDADAARRALTASFGSEAALQQAAPGLLDPQSPAALKEALADAWFRFDDTPPPAAASSSDVGAPPWPGSSMSYQAGAKASAEFSPLRARQGREVDAARTAIANSILSGAYRANQPFPDHVALAELMQVREGITERAVYQLTQRGVLRPELDGTLRVGQDAVATLKAAPMRKVVDKVMVDAIEAHVRAAIDDGNYSPHQTVPVKEWTTQLQAPRAEMTAALARLERAGLIDRKDPLAVFQFTPQRPATSNVPNAPGLPSRAETPRGRRSQVAYDELRRAIDNKTLKPNERLDMPRASKELGLGAEAVRHAVRRLIDEGVLEIRTSGKLGTFVKP